METFFSVQDFEDAALRLLPQGTREFYRNGAVNEETLQRNIQAFKEIVLRPRFLLKDVSKRDMSSWFLDIKTSMPIGVAPTALQQLAHPEGEAATAKACGQANVIYIMSTMSTMSIEDVSTAAPTTWKWLQLYVYKDRDVSARLIKRAEKCGFKAIVLTVDAPVIGMRLGEAKSKFSLPPHLKAGNFVEEAETIGKMEANRDNGWMSLSDVVFDSSMTWDIIAWLRKITTLPILVKGILSEEDAKLAVAAKVDGIIVSNHGGRQLDTSPATIEVLPQIVDAVGKKIPVFIDGGIRNGTDVAKALALGAKGVFIGRPILHGLTLGGVQGVRRVLDILRKEFDVVMALSGCVEVNDFNLNHVGKRTTISKL
jgi:(S)-2-hydroxy-acid oxidase